VRSERGSAPIWFLGLSLCVLMVGALSAELWRAIGERQELVAMADAAAIAAAATIDLDHYRATGEAVIDRHQAPVRAMQVIAGHSGGSDLSAPPAIAIADDGSSVTVELVREVPFGLIRIFAFEDERFMVSGRAVAYPYSPP
jgi:putative Flp pilus-assembly TadE/G-like protein